LRILDVIPSPLFKPPGLRKFAAPPVFVNLKGASKFHDKAAAAMYLFRSMLKKLFLLDAMALVYRAHFALIQRPIFTSKGVNSSALYGFTQTLLQIVNEQKPTHIAVAFDTDAPTQRHKEFAEYKSQRQAMPEDLSAALPHVRRMIQAFNIEILECDGCEADDIIGTLVGVAEKQGFSSYMVTPDKDFGQLVTENTLLYKPSRMGDGIEIMGVKEILARWGIQKTEQVIDILGLMGDSSDNIPGVPGIGEKTASKLIGQFGSIENLFAHLDEVKGKLKDNLITHKESALLSKRLATIDSKVPISLDIERFKIKDWDKEALKALFVEFEFNTIGKRLFGDEFQAGRGGRGGVPKSEPKESQLNFDQSPAATQPVFANLKSIKDVPHTYEIIRSATERQALLARLQSQPVLALAVECSHPDPKQACITGLGFTVEPHKGWFFEVPSSDSDKKAFLQELRPLLQNESTQIIGHNLKQALSVFRWADLCVQAKLFDTMLAHSLIEPDMRHSLGYMAEANLGYTPISFGSEQSGELNLQTIEQRADKTIEEADLALQLRSILEPQLKDKHQEKVFYEIEAELIPALVEMEFEGIRVDAKALEDFGIQLGKEMTACEGDIYRLSGGEFNLNSPKQLGEILFERLKLVDGAKKTKTGQYATSEQILQELAGEHEIVRRILGYREASKLKSTYVDTLPGAIWSKTNRIHTTFRQTSTSTGRLASDNPNLQNIPIRTEQGREIRKAFVPRDKDHLLLSADYSQIELRIIAALSKEPGLLEAFQKNLDIHTATAARVFGVMLNLVTEDMRRKAKMVNYGLSYGMSAFGLAQRLGIPRREAMEIIDHYFAQFPLIRRYMTDTIEFARERGYVETVTGRRRYLRDVRSSNATIRGAAERNAINAPIQGTAADMIKIAMARIHREICKRKLKSRMLLQVHDELVFDLYTPEEKELRVIVEEQMKSAIPLDVPIEMEIGVGQNWLQAH
jgi:DNA polymerase-1